MAQEKRTSAYRAHNSTGFAAVWESGRTAPITKDEIEDFGLPIAPSFEELAERYKL